MLKEGIIKDHTAKKKTQKKNLNLIPQLILLLD